MVDEIIEIIRQQLRLQNGQSHPSSLADSDSIGRWPASGQAVELDSMAERIRSSLGPFSPKNMSCVFLSSPKNTAPRTTRSTKHCGCGGFLFCSFLGCVCFSLCVFGFSVYKIVVTSAVDQFGRTSIYNWSAEA